MPVAFFRNYYLMKEGHKRKNINIDDIIIKLT